MKRYLAAPLIALALFLGTAGLAPVAHAQGGAVDSNLSNNQLDTNGNIIGTAGASSVTANQAAQNAAAQTVTDPSGVSSGFGPIMTWIASLFAWLVGVAALTLDYAVYYTVIRMGDYVHNLTAIGVTWRILRDLANIMLIFGFIGAGIATILNVEKYGWKTKMLPMLLLAAVFLNFSLFVSEGLVDVTNLFATQFFTQINGGVQPTADYLQQTSIGSEGISNKIMAQVGLQTIYTKGAANTEVFKAGNTWTIGFMSILLFIITAFVMFSLAFILIARFVALIFFIALSPVAFMGLAIPQMEYRAGQWWKNFLEQIVTAPVLLLLLYVALAVITDAQFLTGFCIPSAGSTNASCAADWTGFATGNFQGFASMLLSFLVAMGLLLVVVIKAKSMSAFGSDMAIKSAGKLSFGATAWAGRNSVGWLSQRGSEAFRRTKLSRSPIVGRAISGTLDRGAKASFDVRGATAGGGLKGLGVDAGGAGKGYRDWEKEKIKGNEDYAKTLEQTAGEKQNQKTAEDRVKLMKQTVDAIKDQNKEEREALLGAHREDMDPYSTALKDARTRLARLGPNAAAADIAAARADIAAAQAAQRQKAEQQKQEREELEAQHKQTLNAQQKEVEVHEAAAQKAKIAPKADYAASLTSWPGNLLKRNKKAADAILKEAKKGKSEKDLETLKKVLEDNGAH